MRAAPWLLLGVVAPWAGCAWISTDDLALRKDPDGDGYLGAGAAGDEDCAPFDATLPVLWYLDGDGDGHGVDESVVACSIPDGYAPYPGDCNDADPTIRPGGDERCDPDDNDEDCNGQTDDGDQGIEDEALLSWYRDQDSDSYGVAGQVLRQCEQPEGYVSDGTDCNDADSGVYPGAVEVCDQGIDGDCDGDIAPECPIEGGINAKDVAALYSTTAAGLGLGSSLAVTGDLNGDDVDDLLIGVASWAEDAVFYLVPGGTASADLSGHAEMLHTIRGVGATNHTQVVDGTSIAPMGAMLVGVYTLDASGATTGVSTWTALSAIDLKALDNSGSRPIYAGAPGDGSGRDPAAVGDLDMDGVADIVVGASAYAESGNGNPGAVFMVWGDDAGVPPLVDGATATPMVVGDDDGDQMGAVVGVADVTGDGVDDLIVGAPGASDGSFLDMGTLSVYPGPLARAPEYLADPVLFLMGGSNGATLADRGAYSSDVDLDGDGINDMLVGATDRLVQDGWALPSTGRASVILGGASTASGLGEIYATYEGVLDHDEMGARVAFAGDLNGDALLDLVLGGPQDDRTDVTAAVASDGDNAGSLYVFTGPLSGGTHLVTDAPTSWIGASGDGLGTGLAAGLDITGDSLSDLVIAAPGRASDAGEVYVMKPGS